MAAKKQDVSRALGDLLQKPEPQAEVKQAVKPSAPSGFPFCTGNVKPTGIGLRTGELELLGSIAEEWGVGRNFVARWLVITGLQRYLAGDLPEPPRRLP